MNGHDIVKEWLSKSKNDLIVAKHIFEDLHPRQLDISCYHCQQAVEKSLKAVLLNNEVEPPKTHNLIVLCQMCIDICTDFESILEQCSELTIYDTITRYPNEIGITETHTKSAIQKAEHVCKMCSDFIK